MNYFRHAHIFATLVMCFSTWHSHAVIQACQTSPPKTASQPQEESKPAETLAQELEKLAIKGRKNFEGIKTAQLQIQSSRSVEKLNLEIDLIQCKALITNLDLVSKPENIGKLRNALSAKPSARLKQSNWGSPTDFIMSGKKVRTATKSYRPNELDIHITDPDTTIRWDSANQYMTILNRSEDNYHQYKISDFVAPVSDFPPLKEARAQMNNGQISYTIGDAKTNDCVLLDSLSGYPTQRHGINGRADSLSLWLGWKDFGGVRFPQLIANFRFKDGKLTSYRLERIASAKFNIETPDHLFKIGAPAGATVYNKVTKSSAHLNEDVFDVTSYEQVKAAGRRNKRELTPEEKRGVVAAKGIYTLKEGEHLKRIGPPFPLARKYVPQTIGFPPTLGPGKPSWVISQKGEKLVFQNTFSNGVYNIKSIIEHVFLLPSTQIIGDRELLKLEIKGDFVIQKERNQSELFKALKKILEEELQTKLVFEARKVARPVYLIRGDLKLNLDPRRNRVQVHGGDYKGLKGEIVQNGNLDQFSKSLALYLNAKVVNDANPTKEKFKWSERWYDAGIKANRPANGFELKPENVIKIVSEQTGLEITKESEDLNVIVLERAN